MRPFCLTTGGNLVSVHMCVVFKLTTVKPACNDHLYNKIFYLWFIQLCARRQRSIPLGGRYRQVSLYYFLPLVICQNWHLGAYVLFLGCISVCYVPKLSFWSVWSIFCLYVCSLLAKTQKQFWQVHWPPVGSGSGTTLLGRPFGLTAGGNLYQFQK